MDSLPLVSRTMTGSGLLYRLHVVMLKLSQPIPTMQPFGIPQSQHRLDRARYQRLVTCVKLTQSPGVLDICFIHLKQDPCVAAGA